MTRLAGSSSKSGGAIEDWIPPSGYIPGQLRPSIARLQRLQ